MTTLPEELAKIAGPHQVPTAAQIDADLARGRRALRRRRAAQAGAGSVFAVAALTAGLAYASLSPATPPAGPVAGSPPAASTSAAVAGAPAIQLVAYRGEQPRGFELDKVPAGWELQAANDGGITIAPKGFADKNPDVFVGKVTALLQPSYPADELKGKPVTVAGNPGVLTRMADQTDGYALFVELAKDRYLVVQVWDGLGWTEAQVLDFAAGIHVGADATMTAG